MTPDEVRAELARRQEQIRLAEEWIARPECTADEAAGARQTIENHRREIAALPEIQVW